MSIEQPNTQPQTESLEEKLKDSKVRDENGNLLIVYHFSDQDFDNFSLDHVGQNFDGDKGFFGAGVYFTGFADASAYGSKRYAAYLNLRNPLILHNPSLEDIQKLHGKREALLAEGYDGVMVWSDALEGKTVATGKLRATVPPRPAGWSEICVLNTGDIYPLRKEEVRSTSQE